MTRELTPEEAYRRYEGVGGFDSHNNAEIAEEFDVSKQTVRRRRKTFEEMQETAEKVVDDKLNDLGIGENVEDDEPDDNPYASVECPECGSHVGLPDEPGETDCPGCSVRLRIEESDYQ